MTINNFTPSPDELAKWKALQVPACLAILKRVEGGEKLVGDRTKSCVKISTDGWQWNNAGIRNIRTLEKAGLIAPVEYDDYIEYRLTYTGTFEELVRHANNQDSE